MTIHLRLFGEMREYLPAGLPRRGGPLEVADGVRAQQLILSLGIPYGGEEGEIVVAVNDVQVDHSQRLREGDTVSIFEPLAGG